MKDRWLTLMLAGGALALFYALIVPKPAADNKQITHPLSDERGPNGYAAMRAWLELEKIPVISLRERFATLQQHRQARVIAPTGNLLITTMPHRLAIRPAENNELQTWLRRGNTLLVMAALADTPDWAMQAGMAGDFIEQLEELTGIKFVVAKSETEEKITKQSKTQRLAEAITHLLDSEQREFIPIGEHALLKEVHSVLAISEFPANDWRAEKGQGLILELAKRRSTNEAALWLTSIGSGQIIVSGFGSPFTNKLIGEKDNAQWLANIVQWSVGDNGKVIIDDVHQGAVAFYNPEAFFGDARLHRALLWLLLLWLVFVIGPSRLRPVATRWNPVDTTSFVRATGGFFARTLRPTEAGQRAIVLFFNSIRRRLGLREDGTPVWDWLGNQANVPPKDLSLLRQYYERIATGRRINLSQLNNLLRRIKGSFV